MGDQACRNKTVLSFGVVHLLLGLAMLVLGILTYVWNSWARFFYSGPGIWTGILVIIFGAVGFGGGFTRTRGVIIAFMVLSILEAIFVWEPVLVISYWSWIADQLMAMNTAVQTWSTAAQAACISTSYNATNNGTVVYYTGALWGCSNMPAANANLGLVIMSGLLLKVAVVSAIVSCCAVCKCCGAEPYGSSPTMPMQQPTAFGNPSYGPGGSGGGGMPMGGLSYA